MKSSKVGEMRGKLKEIIGTLGKKRGENKGKSRRKFGNKG